MEIFFIVFLVLLNGVFSMSEMAVSVSRKARLSALVEAGDKAAQKALSVMENPTHFLSTVQIGITSISILNGIVGEAAFSQSVSSWFVQLGLGQTIADVSATTVVVLGITFASIVFGEIVPKRIGLLFPEPIARAVAGPMQILARITRPFVYLLSGSTQAVLTLLRLNKMEQPGVTEEEIKANLSEGVVAGLIQLHEHRMVHNVFHLDERSLSSMMQPRSDIDWLQASLGIHEALNKATQSGHSHYPVCRDDLEHVLGIVSIQDMLHQQESTQPLQSLCKPAVFVPETLSGMELLDQFRTQSLRMVLVVDEYGVVQGLLTPFDLLEAITGELYAEQEAWATQEPQGQWRLSGAMPLAELKDRLGIKTLPNEEKGQYNTLAGLLMAESGRLLQAGESVEIASWRFRIEALDGYRIDAVCAQPLGAVVR